MNATPCVAPWVCAQYTATCDTAQPWTHADSAVWPSLFGPVPSSDHPTLDSPAREPNDPCFSHSLAVTASGGAAQCDHCLGQRRVHVKIGRCCAQCELRSAHWHSPVSPSWGLKLRLWRCLLRGHRDLQVASELGLDSESRRVYITSPCLPATHWQATCQCNGTWHWQPPSQPQAAIVREQAESSRLGPGQARFVTNLKYTAPPE